MGLSSGRYSGVRRPCRAPPGNLNHYTAMQKSVRVTTWMTVSLLALPACKRANRAADVIVEPVVVPTSTPGDATTAGPARADRETSNGLNDPRARLREPIHFAFDRSDLSADARSSLERKAQLLAEHSELRIRIDGHTDERGSHEYNIALGQRRAAAARRYLVLRDIAPQRIEITTFGEERPLCTAADESCWGRNRRSEFTLIP